MKNLPVLNRIQPTFQKIFPKNHHNSSKPPILFLHGFMGSKMNMKQYAQQTSTELNRDCFILDARNHGASHPHCLPMDYDSLTNDLELFINENIRTHYKTHSTVDIFGYSMGAKTAMNYALRHPSNVGKLILADNAPVAQPVEGTIHQLLDAARSLHTWFDELYSGHGHGDGSETVKGKGDIRNWKVHGFEKLKPMLQNDILCYYVLACFKKSNKKIVYQHGEPVFDPQTIINMGDFPTFDPSMSSLSNETLVFKAKKSTMINENGIKKLNEFFPNNKIIEYDTDHESLLLEYKDEILKESLLFLK